MKRKMLTAPLNASDVHICSSLPPSDECFASLGPFSFTRGAHLTSTAADFAGLSSLSARAVDGDHLLSVTDFGLWVVIPRSPAPGSAEVVALHAKHRRQVRRAVHQSPARCGADAAVERSAWDRRAAAGAEAARVGQVDLLKASVVNDAALGPHVWCGAAAEAINRR